MRFHRFHLLLINMVQIIGVIGRSDLEYMREDELESKSKKVRFKQS